MLSPQDKTNIFILLYSFLTGNLLCSQAWCSWEHFHRVIHSSLGWEIACGPKAGAASGQWSLAAGTSLWSIASRVRKMHLGAIKHCIEVSQCLAGKLSQHLSTQSFRGRTGKDILSFTNKCTFPQLKCWANLFPTGLFLASKRAICCKLSAWEAKPRGGRQGCRSSRATRSPPRLPTRPNLTRSVSQLAGGTGATTVPPSSTPRQARKRAARAGSRHRAAVASCPGQLAVPCSGTHGKQGATGPTVQADAFGTEAIRRAPTRDRGSHRVPRGL